MRPPPHQSTTALIFAALLSLTLSACGAAQEPAPTAPTATPPTETAAPASANDAPAGHRIEIATSGVVLDGAPLEEEYRGKLERVDALFDALHAVPTTSRDVSAGPAICALSVADEAPAGWLKSVFLTAVFAGQARVTLDLGAGTLTLRGAVPPLPGTKVTEADPPWPEEVLILRVDPAHTELWLAPVASPSSDGSDPKEESGPAARMAELPSGATPTELRRALDAACSGRPCSPALLFVENPVTFGRIRLVLEAFRGSVMQNGTHDPVVELGISEPSQLPVPPKAPRRTLETTVSGRLPAGVIQETVRKSFGKFRKCYEQGLVADPTLTGRVRVRFVIARDGKVSAVQNDGSDMPEAVVSCVVAGFKTLTFPAPEGGILTVVYPIHFEPE